MPSQDIPSAHRRLAQTLVPALLVVLAACGGDDGAVDDRAQPLASNQSNATGSMSIAAAAQTNVLQVAVTIPGYPHKVDVYWPAGATKALVFLHGHGGRSSLSAYDLGFNRVKTAPTAKTVNWDWLARNQIAAVFPQGQIKPGTTSPTWSNYVMDSGQNDVAFLQALSTYVKAQYRVSAVSLAGHSAGGAMTARMWCEATTSYKFFVALAGPMPSQTYPMPGPTCAPLAPAPYFAVIGGKDTKLSQFTLGMTTPTLEQMAAGLTDTILTSEWRRHQDRSEAICGEMPALEGGTVAASGPTWSACGARLRYTVVTDAEHPIASLEQHAGIKMADAIAQFVK